MLPENEETPRGRGIYLLPNLFTITALFFGFYAIIAAMKGAFDNAAIAIFVAMVMDTLDGRVARLTHTQTLFGAELDSLSDMVCFGLAPALIAYLFGLNTLGKAGWLIAFIFTATVALRLARFNTRPNVSDKRFFQGLPCPAGASVLVSLVWSFQEFGLEGRGFNIVIALFSILISVLMVSKLRFYSFKDFDFKNRVPFVVILLILLFIVLISVDPPLVWLGLSVLYIGVGPVFWLWRRHKRKALSRKD
ncbi:MAG: CDP-diacylglycerol--serine O-phosphatidyltransferase [Gammaproteobacteria bacterium]